MHEVLVNCLFNMTTAVDLGRKATKQTNKHEIGKIKAIFGLGMTPI